MLWGIGRIACAVALVTLWLAQSAPAEPAGPLGHSGRWITDADGRVVILHGVNMVYKRSPYYPAAGGFGADDAAFLEENGFNTVRLGLIYKGVEPQPGSYDEAYLNQIGATEQTLAAHGVFSLLDFHQDLYNERFQGEGWPDWAVQDDGLPALPQVGFPGNYLAMPALNRAFDHFWANDAGPGGVGLQNRYAAAFGHVARRFDSNRHVLGYDLMNEPWPGSVYPTCVNPAGCPLFDLATLTPFMKRVISRIRAESAQRLVWYEPLLTFDFGAQTWLGDMGDPSAGMSFHDYCLPGIFGGPTGDACETFEDLPFQNADSRAAATGDALLLTEFGATDDLATIERIIDNADRHMVGWQYWHYCGCDDPTTQGPAQQAIVNDASKPPTGDNVRQAKLDVLSRPYPQAIAGTPESYGFDPATDRFHLAYSTTGLGGESFGPSTDTEIFVGGLHYPGGYDVDVDGGTVRSPAGAPLLTVASCPGAAHVSVTVGPAGQGSGGQRGCAAAMARNSRCAALRGKLKRAKKKEQRRRLRARIRKRGC
ncbi:MAG: cellulase family glycosylhydrolase [Solirubrobacterales bacterium]